LKAEHELFFFTDRHKGAAYINVWGGICGVGICGVGICGVGICGVGICPRVLEWQAFIVSICNVACSVH